MVQKAVAQCANCALNRFHATRPEKSGNQIFLEPNAAGAIDLAGPLGAFAASPSTGRGRYIFVYCDLHSRFVFAAVIPSADDAAVLDGLTQLRDRLSGFPRRVIMDNALVLPGSRSAQFLKERGVRITHGLATVSRCQSKVERTIQSLTRLVCKIHTDQPRLSFPKIVAEAVLTFNNSPSDGLPDGLSPNDVHFVRSPSTFPRHAYADGTGSGADALVAARLTSRRTVVNDVRRFLRRHQLSSPTDYTRKLKIGDLCLRRRTSFAASSPKKLQFKLKIEAYRVVSKVATNSFRVVSIVSGGTCVLPGDVLIKVSALDEDELRALCREMESTAARNAALTTTDDADARDGAGRRIRRSARLTERRAPVMANIASLFRSAP